MGAEIEKFFTENAYYKWVGNQGPVHHSGPGAKTVDGLARTANWGGKWFNRFTGKSIGVHFQGPQGIARAQNNVVLGMGALLAVAIAGRLLKAGALTTLAELGIITFNIAPGAYVWIKESN